MHELPIKCSIDSNPYANSFTVKLLNIKKVSMYYYITEKVDVDCNVTLLTFRKRKSVALS